MANLEETQDADLDAILGELCALDSEYDEEISRVSSGNRKFPTEIHEYKGHIKLQEPYGVAGAVWSR